MYVDGFIDKKKTGEVLHVAERIHGQRILREIQPVYEYYVESDDGTYNTITGTKAKKLEFTRYSEMRKSVETHSNKKLFESDCNVTFKTLAKHYMGKSSPDLNVLFFDIETDFHPKFGYASPHDPFNRVTAISLYQSWTGKDYVLTLAPTGMEIHEAQEIINRLNEETNDPNSTVVLYTSESDMFNDFFELIEDSDVLSGWNSEFFDIPYMINRTKKLFSEAYTARWCLWNRKPIAREADMFGKTVITYDLVGRVHLDYLALYKKHAGQVEQSYKLDYIAEKVTGENKVAYEGSLDRLYKEDYETFLRYSKQDSILLKKIDEKMDFISLHNRLAHKESVLISTTMGSVALIDTAIINLAHERGEVVFDKKQLDEEDLEYDFSEIDYSNDDLDTEDMPESTSKAAGAWVQDPVLGLIDMLGVVDFNSLYPTVLRTLGMSTECILGQIRQTYTDEYLAAKIEEQRMHYNGKKFKPKWTEAWHGLFATVEFTMVREKSKELLTVDLEDGTTFQCTGAELHDLIYGEGSNIVLSANGTLFDKSKNGVIPEILTRWYSERKSQQKMVIDYKHLASDGWELSETACAEICKVLNTLEYKNSIYKTNLHEDDPVYLIRCALTYDKYSEIANLIANNGFYIKDNHIHCAEEDKEYCEGQSAFWKQNQQIRKILLNSLYGALLNKGSRFFDKRLGQSVTLTGRSMTKHMASKINEVCTDTYNHTGGVVIYGDSVTGDSMIDVIINGEPKSICIEELYEMFIGTEYSDKNDKEYVIPDLLVKTYSTSDDCVYYDNAKSIMRHKNTNDLFEISTEHHKIKTTSDHSIVAEIDGELGEYTPLEIKEFLESGCDVYMIIS